MCHKIPSIFLNRGLRVSATRARCSLLRFVQKYFKVISKWFNRAITLAIEVNHCCHAMCLHIVIKLKWRRNKYAQVNSYTTHNCSLTATPHEKNLLVNNYATRKELPRKHLRKMKLFVNSHAIFLGSDLGTLRDWCGMPGWVIQVEHEFY